MRDLNDYKAEIFRRSEEKIKERRRNRNRILAFCIPLCLVFAAVTFAKLPGISVYDENVSNVSDTEFIQVEVQEPDDKLQSKVVTTDTKVVSDVYRVIQSAFDAEVQENSTANDYSYTNTTSTFDDMVVQDSLSLFSSSKYEMVFTTANGESFSYTLNGTELTDNATRKKVTLTNKQCFEIQSKLGLLIVWEEEK